MLGVPAGVRPADWSRDLVFDRRTVGHPVTKESANAA
jgi:hypothetical protein